MDKRRKQYTKDAVNECGMTRCLIIGRDGEKSPSFEFKKGKLFVFNMDRYLIAPLEWHMERIRTHFVRGVSVGVAIGLLAALLLARIF